LTLETRNWGTEFLNKKSLNMKKEVAYRKILKYNKKPDKFGQIFRQSQVQIV
jgi:hypothetical protein